MKVPVVVLAGGQSSRFKGHYKALAQLCGKPLVAHVADNLAPLASRLVIVAHSEEQARLLSSALAGRRYEVAFDLLGEVSPLVGLYTAACTVGTGTFAVAPVDTPFVRAEAYERMLSRIGGHAAVIPQWPNGYIEPLLAVYRAEPLREIIPRLLREGQARVSALTGALDVVKVPVSEVFSNPDLETFNVNTEKDLLLAEELCAHLHGKGS